jgi:hypothetical protein
VRVFVCRGGRFDSMGAFKPNAHRSTLHLHKTYTQNCPSTSHTFPNRRRHADRRGRKARQAGRQARQARQACMQGKAGRQGRQTSRQARQGKARHLIGERVDGVVEDLLHQLLLAFLVEVQLGHLERVRLALPAFRSGWWSGEVVRWGGVCGWVAGILRPDALRQ